MRILLVPRLLGVGGAIALAGVGMLARRAWRMSGALVRPVLLGLAFGVVVVRRRSVAIALVTGAVARARRRSRSISRPVARGDAGRGVVLLAQGASRCRRFCSLLIAPHARAAARSPRRRARSRAWRPRGAVALCARGLVPPLGLGAPARRTRAVALVLVGHRDRRRPAPDAVPGARDRPRRERPRAARRARVPGGLVLVIELGVAVRPRADRAGRRGVPAADLRASSAPATPRCCGGLRD